MVDEATAANGNGANQQEDASVIYLDGQGYTLDDLTFEEQSQYQEWLKRDIAPPTPCKPCRGEGIIRLESAVELCPRCSGDGEIDETRERDYIVGLIAVIKRRTDPQFTIDDARRYKPADLKRPKDGNLPPT